MSRDMTKSTKWLCALRRLRSAWASTQSDQSLRCPHEESLGPSLPNECTAKTLIRLGRCPGWSESSLGAHSLCLFSYAAAQIQWCFPEENILRSKFWASIPYVCRQVRPVYGLLLALGYKGSEWGSKLGCLDMQYVDEKVWGCGLGVFDLVGCNGPCQHVCLGPPNRAY